LIQLSNRLDKHIKSKRDFNSFINTSNVKDKTKYIPISER